MMFDLANYAANLVFGAVSQPIDWDLKSRADNQRLARIMDPAPKAKEKPTVP